MPNPMQAPDDANAQKNTYAAGRDGELSLDATPPPILPADYALETTDDDLRSFVRALASSSPDPEMLRDVFQRFAAKVVGPSFQPEPFPIPAPADLFLPRAGTSQFRFLQPSEANLYSQESTTGAPESERSAALASAANGTLFARGKCQQTTGAFWSAAFIGFIYSPSRPGNVTILPRIRAVVSHLWDVSLGPVGAVRATITLRASITTGALLQNPATGTWGSIGSPTTVSLLGGPTGLTYTGGGLIGPISTSPFFDGGPTATTVIVQPGNVYIFGVTALARADVTLDDFQGRVVSSAPSGNFNSYEVYTLLSCNVPSIRVV
jgi:hypothetical protein